MTCTVCRAENIKMHMLSRGIIGVEYQCKTAHLCILENVIKNLLSGVEVGG